jgi:mannose-6-phosphate isomerase
MRPEPTRIEPIFSPRIWGARSLDPLFPEKTNLKEPIGEAWLTGVDCRIASGPYAGKTLGEAWREMPAEWRGTRLVSTAQFPLLVKFIFPTDKLSIQVHPDDAYAAAHEQAAGGRGKTEMWHVISTEPGARLMAGLKPGITKEAFRQALNSQNIEDLFQPHEVHAGDTFFIPAGTPHTIGPGMILCEVQEYSDLTYRLCDYGRVDAHGKPRELHIEKALEVMEFGASPVRPFRWNAPMDEFGAAYVYYLAACRYFAAEKWDVDGLGATQSTDSNRFELLTILTGSGEIRWDGGVSALVAGETWFLPACLGKFIILSPGQESEIIRTYVPDIDAFDRMIAAKGYSKEDRRRFIFP